MRSRIQLCSALLTAILIFPAAEAAADSKKKPNDECTNDSECKDHCYTKKNGMKVCVDCTPDMIDNTRKLIDIWCHQTEKKCSRCQAPREVWEEDYHISIDAFKKCIEWRKTENEKCWDGGNPGHKDAVDQSETGKRNCEDNLSDCKSYGLTYTCSESTYAAKNGDTDRYCVQDQGSLCERLSKDSTKADCRTIEDEMKQAGKCKDAVDSLKSSCLDRLSRRRDGQREKANKAYYSCKEMLDYKRSNNLCN